MALKQATKPPIPPRTADSGSVEHWQFYDGEAGVLEQELGFSEPVAWLYGGEQVECYIAS